MNTTHELSKAIQKAHDTKMEGIRQATRAKYIDLVIGTALFLVFVASVFLIF